MNWLTPCSFDCPVNTNVPAYINAIVKGDYEEAYQIVRENNPFPSVCAWICPHPCEDNCRRGQVDEPVNIRALKKFAVERGGKKASRGKIILKTKDDRLLGGDVAVIGAGPAGLTAAYDLVRAGFSVTVLDKHDAPGGHLFASLPLHRLPREAVAADVHFMLEHGVDLHCGLEVGRDLSLKEIRARFKSVILAVGLQKGIMLDLPGAAHPAVMPALSFLQGVNQGQSTGIAGRVVVIGGGDVAMDVARTALRCGARKVTVVCLEAEDEMPAHKWEVQEALAEGVRLCTRFGPRGVIAQDEQGAAGLEIQRVTRVFDEQGRFSPVFAAGEMGFIPAGMIIVAAGQAPDVDFVRGDLELDHRGGIAVNKGSLATSVQGVFSCGEAATGPGPAIAAIASGHKVARTVAAYLNGKSLDRHSGPVKVIAALSPELVRKIIRKGRQELPLEAAGERVKKTSPGEGSFTGRQARAEAGRCLRCDLGAEVDLELCVSCLTCQRVCPYGIPAVESRAMISPEACQACGICVAACPAGAITLGGKKSFAGGFLEPGAFGMGPVSTPVIKVYVCRRVTGAVLVSGFENSIPGANIAVRVLPCAGSLRRDDILKDFEQGFSGVALVACAGGCSNDLNSARQQAVEFMSARRICATVGLDEERLLYLYGEGQEQVAEELNGFAQRLNRLGLLWGKGSG